MIAVEWDDFNAPRGPANVMLRRSGKLLQVGLARMDGELNPINVAFVITKCIDSDKRYGTVKVGDTIILPLLLNKIVIKGVEVPLFGN